MQNHDIVKNMKRKDRDRQSAQNFIFTCIMESYFDQLTSNLEAFLVRSRVAITD